MKRPALLLTAVLLSALGLTSAASVATAATHASSTSAARMLRDRGYLVPNEAQYAAAKARAAGIKSGNVATGGVTAAAAPYRPSQSPSFAGQFNGGLSPSDSNGAIGPSAYVETINTRLGVYSRTGAVQYSTDLGSLTSTSDSILSDPQVIWDQTDQRFYFVVLDIDVAFGGSTDGFDFFFGYSQNADPSSLNSWCVIPLNFGYDGAGELPDQPHLGDSTGFLFWGVNNFLASNSSYLGSDVDWLQKPPPGGCVGGGSLNQGMQSNLTSNGVDQVWTPVGVNQTDAATDGWVVADDWVGGGPSTNLYLFKVTDNNDGTASVDSVGTLVTVGSYAIPANAIQYGSAYRLDTSDGRLTQAVSAIDPSQGGQLAIWTQHTVVNGLVSKIDWYEIDPVNHVTFRTGAVTDSNLWVFDAGISPDRVAETAFGNTMTIGFNTSSYLSDVSLWMASQQGSGSLSAWVMVQHGPMFSPEFDFTCFNSQNTCRWGDYMSASPDPGASISGSHGQVWLTGMYNVAGTNSAVDWRTWNWGSHQIATTSTCTMWGGAAGDLMIGGSGADVICGNGGSDLVVGMGGNDMLHGGVGNDTLLPGPGIDKVYGELGYDYVDYELAAVGIHANLSTGSGTGEGTDSLFTIEAIIGSQHNDTLTGNGGGNVLLGLGGVDYLYGLAGNDALYGYAGNDHLYGGLGFDYCNGGLGADTKNSCETGPPTQPPTFPATAPFPAARGLWR